jgi:hypothetical protein
LCHPPEWHKHFSGCCSEATLSAGILRPDQGLRTRKLPVRLSRYCFHRFFGTRYSVGMNCSEASWRPRVTLTPIALHRPGCLDLEHLLSLGTCGRWPYSDVGPVPDWLPFAD